MKKILFAALMLLVGIGAQAQTSMEKFMNECKDNKKATVVTIPRSLLKLALPALKGDAEKELLKQISSVKIVSMEDASRSLRKKAVDAAMASEKEGLTRIIQQNDKDEHNYVLAKPEDEVLTQVYLLNIDDSDLNVVLVEGKINPADIEKVIGVIEKKAD